MMNNFKNQAEEIVLKELIDEMNLICTYNLESKEDAQNLRMQYIEKITPLKEELEKLKQLYKKATNEADKTIIVEIKNLK